MSTIDELLGEACKRAELREISPNEFELKHLFSKQEWKSLSNADRRELGRKFSLAVRLKRVSGIRHAGEEINHHNLYIKC